MALLMENLGAYRYEQDVNCNLLHFLRNSVELTISAQWIGMHPKTSVSWFSNSLSFQSSTKKEWFIQARAISGQSAASHEIKKACLRKWEKHWAFKELDHSILILSSGWGTGPGIFCWSMYKGYRCNFHWPRLYRNWKRLYILRTGTWSASKARPDFQQRIEDTSVNNNSK